VYNLGIGSIVLGEINFGGHFGNNLLEGWERSFELAGDNLPQVHLTQNVDLLNNEHWKIVN